MNKLFFILSIIIYVLNYIIIEACDINAHNSLWSAIYFVIILVLLCIGCILNSIIYKQKNSSIRFLFYYFSIMCSFGIVLLAILSSFILSNKNDSFIISFIYLIISMSSIIGYLISKKYKYKYKIVFGYFSLLFPFSLLINIILTIINVF
ncbi:hypothetical protein [uncultured Clostridium sp.]|uniref:hypothetical protein n=1 Tax=uncultured Clostridium sp. TaxID=59620 RepID=UPI00272B1991|nr:hypothetical protein [uncultured Clostridium sp.]